VGASERAAHRGARRRRALNLAVHKFEEFLTAATNFGSDADFTYNRPMKGHSSHAWTWGEFVRLFAASVRRSAPAGEDVRAWSY
jgi:hypothetical protein